MLSDQMRYTVYCQYDPEIYIWLTKHVGPVYKTWHWNYVSMNEDTVRVRLDDEHMALLLRLTFT